MSAAAKWLVDGHVHFHACFARASFLDHAAQNFERAQPASGPGAVLGVLLLTECAGARFFAELREAAARGDRAAAWRFSPTAEPESLAAVRADGATLLVVAGRQIVTREALEVLALATCAVFADGRPASETLAAVRVAGGLPVLPWGFGKWWRARGRLVASIIDREEPTTLFLADNGGRPRLAARPPLFAVAERRGIRVLAGSDPLPFPRHAGRAGSFGFHLAADLDPRAPAASLKRELRDGSTQPRTYGERAALGTFVRDQVGMQLRKLRSRRP